MPIRSLLLGLIAISALLILGVFLQSLFQSAPVEHVAAPPKQVLVAAADLPHGRLLRPEDVKWQTVDNLPAGSDTNALATQPGGSPTTVDTHSLGDNVGAITRHDVSAGEVLQATDVVKPGDSGFLKAVLAPGKRAITVSVNTLSGSSAGLIYAGDHVDVILTQTFHEANLPIGLRLAGEDIAQNLRVLAIDHYTQGGTVANGSEAQVRNSARTVTLEADPTLAVKIANAAELGKLSLILRSVDAENESTADNADDVAPIWAQDTSKALAEISRLSPEAKPAEPAPAPAQPVLLVPHQVVVYRGDQIARSGDQPAPSAVPPVSQAETAAAPAAAPAASTAKAN
jgi:pilus assembly protein CpaB